MKTPDKAILKEQLQFYTKSELIEMLIKLSVKGHNFDYLLVNYLDIVSGEQLLFEDTLHNLNKIRIKEFKGRTKQHQRVKMLVASIKCVGEFKVETRNKKLEADLMLNILQNEFNQSEPLFGTKISGYDYKISILLKRLINLVETKLHPDYLADYQENINSMLDVLHANSNRIKTISDLPREID